MKITQYKALGFSYYGTLVDRNRGVLNALRPLLERAPHSVQPDALLRLYRSRVADERCAAPTIGQRQLQCIVHDAIARSLGIPANEAVDWEQAMAFAKRLDQWPIYEDVPGALQYLSKFYQLIVVIPGEPGDDDALSERLMNGDALQVVYQTDDVDQTLADTLATANVHRSELLPVRGEEADDPWGKLMDQPLCTLRRDTLRPWNHAQSATDPLHCEFANMADLVLAHQNALRR